MANNSGDLKKFAQAARRQLREQVAGRMEQVLKTDSAELRQKEAAVNELRKQIARTSKKAVIDRVAYTWFNRFCALRFMDANRYNRLAVVSPAEGYTQPEILQEAKKGYIDEDLGRFVNRQGVFDLLGGRTPSSDPQQEAYRLLLVGVCNASSESMPFLFERIEDYTELLMPPDLLSENSVLHQLREVMTPEACQDVEVIGWLYQYYISERKDEVFEALKQNQKIEAEDIPAATQLFTPHWIVRYLVENSLGRLWMLNRPQSRLAEKMEYYIKPVEEETDFLRISSPEEIKICDPACGSGHMLTYAFDLLYAIYEEEGYAGSEIAGLILKHNLYGIEIDERAGALAAFALAMKARGKDRRFFARPAQPNICVLENVSFTDQELREYMDAVGRDLFSEPLRETLKQFEQAQNLGSLIRPILTDVAYVRQTLEAKNLGSNLFLFEIHERILKVMRQSEFLMSRYHVVIANPPYMGDGGMNENLKSFTKAHFVGSADMYGCFIERNLDLSIQFGHIGMITIPNWMFLGSFEELRVKLLKEANISSLIHNGRGVWGSDFGSCSFVIAKNRANNISGIYKRLFNKQGEVNPNQILQQRFFDHDHFPYYFTSSNQLFKVPGYPIAYWINDTVRELFLKNSLGKIAKPRQGIKTGNNDRFLKLWFEVEIKSVALNKDNSDKKWYPCNKGGDFRKWYGNLSFILNWQNNGFEIIHFFDENGKQRSRPQNIEYFFREGITWNSVSISLFGMRYSSDIMTFESSGSCCFPEKKYLLPILGIGNSKIGNYFLTFLSPTITFSEGGISKIPIIEEKSLINLNTSYLSQCVSIAKMDWDSYEISWEFLTSPLLANISGDQTVYKANSNFCFQRQNMVDDLLRLEKENNRIIINAYGLQDELNTEVQIEEITLTCNPHYRYGKGKNKAEYEILMLADTMREFISYSVGCMFGRYSLDKPGLILANQGETLQDYLRQVPDPTFMPDEDNAIPILDGDWFSDDITERFKKFLRVTFGNEHYEENLAFIEEAIGRDIRSYFLKDFYAYHLKMYQKRPIYWLFSSPKGSFNVLIYMHRYTKDTVSVILNRYLREFRAKLEARKGYLEHISISDSASPKEKTQALKEIEKLNQILEEIRVYERDMLYPLAAQPIEIDLDDGVKVNYAKFGKALAVIK